MSGVCNAKDADLRALLCELETSGPVGLAIVDAMWGKFTRAWYIEIWRYANELYKYASHEPFSPDLAKFDAGVLAVGNGYGAGEAKDTSNLRTKAMMQGVLALWTPLKGPLLEYQADMKSKGKGTHSNELKTALQNLDCLLREMEKWSNKYATGGGVWW